MPAPSPLSPTPSTGPLIPSSARASSVPAGPLAGVRILSLALNLPGPAALMRCCELGATCIKFEPPGGDPMRQYSPPAYEALHQGIDVRVADLKTPDGQRALHESLARSDLLLTSFRPSALARLGLTWDDLQAAHPQISQVALVGSAGAAAEIPGHDLTYQAEQDLVPGLHLPSSLYADMGGALMATQAVMQAALQARADRCGPAPSGSPSAGGCRGRYLEVALDEAAAFLALPRLWGLTAPGAVLGGAHAGYRVYACQDGRVAVAALEPHFAQRLMAAAQLPPGSDPQAASVHTALEAFFAARCRQELEALARAHDLPLHTLAR